MTIGKRRNIDWPEIEIFAFWFSSFFTRTDRCRVRITADIVPNCMLIFRCILPSHVNKTLRYLSSATWERISSLKRVFHSFQSEDHCLGHPKCFRWRSWSYEAIRTASCAKTRDQILALPIITHLTPWLTHSTPSHHDSEHKLAFLQSWRIHAYFSWLDSSHSFSRRFCLRCFSVNLLSHRNQERHKLSQGIGNMASFLLHSYCRRGRGLKCEVGIWC